MTEFPDDPHGSDYDDEDEGSRLRERLESLLPNVLRRTVSTGVGAKQYTEDVIRSALGEMKLPKEAVHYLVDVADNTKKEVVRVAAREFREFLDSARFNQELAKILTQLSFEIRTEIRFVPNDQALKPSVSTTARVKTGDSGPSVPAGDEATESINEAIRSGASEMVEMLLAKVLRQKADEAVSDADAAVAEGEGAEAKPTAARPKSPKKDPKPAPGSAAAADAGAEAAAKPKRTRKKSTTSRKKTS